MESNFASFKFDEKLLRLHEMCKRILNHVYEWLTDKLDRMIFDILKWLTADACAYLQKWSFWHVNG